MRKLSQGSLVLKEGDYLRLLSLVGAFQADQVDMLAHEIHRADVVGDDEFPANAVCMHAHVTYQDMTSRAESTVTLVFPGEADVHMMKISVLSPVGTALIGLTEGDMIDWPMPNGRSRLIKVVGVKQEAMASGNGNQAG